MGQTTGKSMQRHSFTPRETCLKSTLNPTGTACSHENTPPQEQRKRAANCAKKITPIIFINKPSQETTPPPPLTSESPGKRAIITVKVLSRFVLFQERLNTFEFLFFSFSSLRFIVAWCCSFYTKRDNKASCSNGKVNTIIRHMFIC